MAWVTPTIKYGFEVAVFGFKKKKSNIGLFFKMSLTAPSQLEFVDKFPKGSG